MKQKRLCVICEGHTEAEFVSQCLEPHLRSFDLHVFPSLLKTRAGSQGGGNVTVERLAKHISHEYKCSNYITTLVDYYGFKKADGRSKQQLEADIAAETQKHIATFDGRRIIPYVQMHEFEALLFSDVEQFVFVLDGWNAKTRQALLSIKADFPTPEDINNSRLTAPSKRIERVFSNGEYSKREHGPIVAGEIGLSKIREECPQFDAWVEALEKLS
jgi:hypothetical protein